MPPKRNYSLVESDDDDAQPVETYRHTNYFIPATAPIQVAYSTICAPAVHPSPVTPDAVTLDYSAVTPVQIDNGDQPDIDLSLLEPDEQALPGKSDPPGAKKRQKSTVAVHCVYYNEHSIY